MSQPVLIIGAGPAGLMAAEVVATAGLAVTVLDQMPSVGRKLLMAGRGGLNLTHSEPLPRLLDRYGAAASLRRAVEGFPPEAVIAWCNGLGQPTFIGSSGRVFPAGMKASPLLRAWLRRLAGLGVRILPRHRWLGMGDGGTQRFQTEAGEIALPAAATILAMGGASWPRLGADGAWTRLLPDVAITKLRPANCGFTVPWSEQFRRRFEGQPLKRIALRFGAGMVRGEALVTADGIEGGAVYALCAEIREHIAASGPAIVHVDLRPDLSAAELARRLDLPRRGQSLSTFLRKTAGLPPISVGLLQEALHQGAAHVRHGGAAPDLPALIKAVPISCTAIRPIDRAISTAGGIALDAVDGHFMLRAHPGLFAAGEMLDWEAPTGGYLLQGCLGTGAAAGRGVLAWLGASAR